MLRPAEGAVNSLLLVNCKGCDDIFRACDRERSCECGRTRALELADHRIQVSGPARVLAIPWEAYDSAVPGEQREWHFLDSPHPEVERGVELPCPAAKSPARRREVE